MSLFEKPIGINIKRSNASSSTERGKLLSEDEMMLKRSLVKGNPFNTPTNKTRKGTPIPDDGYIQQMLSVAGQSQIDARNILRMSPELELGANIYIAGLLSPNDISQSKINFTCEEKDFGALRSEGLEIVESYFRNEFKIDGRLKNWIYKARFSEGATPLMVVPLTTIDQIINESNPQTKNMALESYKSSFDGSGNYKPIRFLGRGVSKDGKPVQRSVRSILGLESSDTSRTLADSGIVDFGDSAPVKFKDAILIHDNVEALKVPQLTIAAARYKMEDYFGFSAFEEVEVALESGDVEKQYDIKREGVELYPQRQFEMEQVVRLQPGDIASNVGHPVFMELPYSSVFAVHPPGKPDEHVGYYIALDESCNPLAIVDKNQMVSGDAMSSGQLGNFASAIIEKGANAVGDSSHHQTQQTVQNSLNLFMTTMDMNMVEMLKNGIFHGVDLAVAQNRDIMFYMFQRALVGKQTQLLFVPTSLLTYIAFDYNEWGLGESKITRYKDIAILASVITVANTLAAIGNAQQLKKVNIQFDEEDPDPQSTDEEIKGWLAKSQYGGSLLNTTRLADQLDMLVQSGYQFTYEGGMEIFPNTRVDIEPITRETAIIDSDWAQKIDKRMIMLTGISPEVVDLTQEVEFAQSYITGNVLRARQAHIEQLSFCEQVDHFIHNFTLNSKVLMLELTKLIKARRDEVPTLKNDKRNPLQLAKHFVKNIRTSLPKPDVTKLEMQLKSIETHNNFIDKVLESYLNENVLNASEVGQKIADKAEGIKAFFKDHLMRAYYEENNLLPPALLSLFSSDDDEKVDVFEQTEILSKKLGDMVLNHEGVAARLRSKNDEKMENLEQRFGAAGDSGSTSTDTDGNQPADGGETQADPAAAGADGNDDLFNDGGVGGSDDSPI